MVKKTSSKKVPKKRISVLAKEFRIKNYIIPKKYIAAITLGSGLSLGLMKARKYYLQKKHPRFL